MTKKNSGTTHIRDSLDVISARLCVLDLDLHVLQNMYQTLQMMVDTDIPWPKKKQTQLPLFSENQSKPQVDQKLNPPEGSRQPKCNSNPCLEVQDRTKNIPVQSLWRCLFHGFNSRLGLEGNFWSESIPTLPQTSGPRPWRSTAPLGEEPFSMVNQDRQTLHKSWI